MTFQDLVDVLRDLAMSKDGQVGLPATKKQKLVVILLFNKFWEDEEGEEAFAADANWFRHRVLELVWGRKSLNELDMASVSIMIDELGTKYSGHWELSERGQDFMFAAWDELAGRFPTQQSLL